MKLLVFEKNLCYGKTFAQIKKSVKYFYFNFANIKNIKRETSDFTELKIIKKKFDPH